MNFFRLLLLVSLQGCLFAGAIHAQTADEALPENSVVEPDPMGDTLPLIPEVSQPFTGTIYEPDLPQSPSVPKSIDRNKSSETRRAIEQQERQVKMRRARIKAERDDKAQALLAQAESAETDAERRFAMKVYYDRIYALMLKIDPTLKQDELKQRKTEAVSSMSQNNLRPSVWAGDPDAGVSAAR